MQTPTVVRKSAALDEWPALLCCIDFIMALAHALEEQSP
jgi:hypothetical protein